MANKYKVIKKITTIAIVFIMIATVPAGTAFAEQETLPQEQFEDDNSDYIEGQILVTYADAGASVKNAAKIEEKAEGSIAAAGAEVTEEVASQSKEQGTLVVVETEKGMSTEDMIDTLEGADGIEAVQPNFKYYLADSEESEPADNEIYTKDPYNNDTGSAQYYLYNTRTVNAWNTGFKSNGKVTVAVLDTGCRMTHEDIKGNLAKDASGNLLAWDAVNKKSLTQSIADGNIGNGGDLQGHGTHVCGIIAATANNGKGIAGVSYNAKLLPINVFKAASGGVTANTIDIVNAYIYLDNLIKNGTLTNLRAINMSLGAIRGSEDYEPGYYDKLLEDKIKAMREENNVLSVCAGGNGDAIGNPYVDWFNFPSDFDACVAVTALNSENKNSSFSDYNKYKDISAPGEYILSTTYRSDSSYGYMTGTSQATPIVSGIIAVMCANAPSLTASETVQRLKQTALPISGDTRFGRYKTNSNPDRRGSAGLVNAENSTLTAQGKLLISDCKIKLSNSEATYTGKAIKPSMTVTNALGEKLIAGKDYDASYSDNVSVGKATVTVKGKGTYATSKSLKFTIKPVPTKIKAISAQSKALAVKWNKKTTQVTGYEIAVSKNKYFKSSKIVTCKSNTTTSAKVTSLQKKKLYYVKVRTYKTVKGSKYYSDWSPVKTKKTK